MVGLTAGETDDPEANLPKAINSLPIRIGLFYVGSMIAVMSVYPWDQITTTASPFVQVFFWDRNCRGSRHLELCCFDGGRISYQQLFVQYQSNNVRAEYGW